MTVQEIVTVNLAILVVSSIAYIIKKIIKHQCNNKTTESNINEPDKLTLPDVQIQVPTIPNPNPYTQTTLPPFETQV